MSLFSNCVDAGTPWEVDANMPYGLGGVRADIGIYGGPDNWFWGGTPVPDGSPVLTSVVDNPQDQGSLAGVLFDASVWDNSTLVNNVTHYSIWRNYDMNGGIVDSVQNGNWELMGYMPAQSFNAYAYSAPTLGDSNLVNGMFNSCFVVVAHTSDSATYWYSNVSCGYSTDDISPSVPNASAIPGANGTDVIVYWDAPTAPDYSYSTVFSTVGFTDLGITDTSTIDVSTLPGGTYTYGVIHYDVNGNPSDTAWVTITIDDNEDVIPLNAGWNLISTNMTPNNNTMTDIFSSLIPGNLVYVTAFNQGSSLYNPNGLSFLNTLTQFTDGYGYWVKVNADDTLRISGSVISPSYKIPLNAGWNLSGYMNPASSDPSSYFSSLISNSNLVYVTSFDNGTQLYNPNGLTFLNSLTTMQRPFGYWIKVNNPVNSGSYRLSNNEGTNFSPDYMFVNGESNLDNYVGEYVEVYSESDVLVAQLEILEGGYLMTTPLYGDDPTTTSFEGLFEGEKLTFRFKGDNIQSDFNFEGNMELKEVNLQFFTSSLTVYPNPLQDKTNINFNLLTSSDVDIKIFDVTGKMIEKVISGKKEEGSHSIVWNASNYEKGVYLIKLYFNNKLIETKRIVIQ